MDPGYSKYFLSYQMIPQNQWIALITMLKFDFTVIFIISNVISNQLRNVKICEFYRISFSELNFSRNRVENCKLRGGRPRNTTFCLLCLLKRYLILESVIDWLIFFSKMRINT